MANPTEPISFVKRFPRQQKIYRAKNPGDFIYIDGFTFSCYFRGLNSAITQFITGTRSKSYAFELVSDGFYCKLGARFGTRQILTDFNIENNRWYHLLMRYDTTKFEFFVDNNLIGSFDTERFGANFPIVDDQLLAFERTKGGNSYTMMLSGIGLWDTYLTDEEIRDITNCFITTQNLIFFDLMNGCITGVYPDKIPDTEVIGVTPICYVPCEYQFIEFSTSSESSSSSPFLSTSTSSSESSSSESTDSTATTSSDSPSSRSSSSEPSTSTSSTSSDSSNSSSSSDVAFPFMLQYGVSNSLIPGRYTDWIAISGGSTYYGEQQIAFASPLDTIGGIILEDGTIMLTADTNRAAPMVVRLSTNEGSTFTTTQLTATGNGFPWSFWDGTKFVVMWNNSNSASNNPEFYTSTDGITWSGPIVSDLLSGDDYTNPNYNGSAYFVLNVTNRSIYTSADLISWSPVYDFNDTSFGVGDSVVSLHYDGLTYILSAILDGSVQILSAPSLAGPWSISLIPTSAQTGSSMSRFAYDGQGNWMSSTAGIGSGNLQFKIFRSIDGGQVWTQIFTGATETVQLGSSIAYSRGIWMAVQFDASTPTNNRMYRSFNNGVNWLNVNIPVNAKNIAKTMDIFVPNEPFR